MKYKSVVNVVVVLVLLVGTSSVKAEPWQGHVGVTLGHQNLDASDWGEFDDLVGLGVRADVKKPDWPVSIALNTEAYGAVSEGLNNDDELGVLTNSLGLQKYFGNNVVKPYLAGGITVVNVYHQQTRDGIEVKDDDSAVGGWASIGAIVDINSHLDIGIDVTYSETQLTVFNTEREIGGVKAELRVGFHW